MRIALFAALVLLSACASEPESTYNIVATDTSGGSHVLDEGLTHAECKSKESMYLAQDYVAFCYPSTYYG